MSIAHVIGRFQPYHRGHHVLISRAFEVADTVVVIVGDTGCRPDYKNPWTFEERKQWLMDTWEPRLGVGKRLHVVPVEDVPYDDEAWVNGVHRAVNRLYTANPLRDKRFLVGHKKDESSFYLDMFPEWQFVEVPNELTLGATAIREWFFYAENHERVRQTLPPAVATSLGRMGVARYRELRAEALAVAGWQEEWASTGSTRYGSQHVAVDAVVTYGDYVLMIERGGDVGNGALALPGGFVVKSERLLPAALRELKEETGVVVPRDIFPKHGLGVVVPFDHPGRSMRGRIFTNALYVDITSHVDTMPMPEAADDAKKAFWMLKQDLPRFKRSFFSDHYHIINYFLENK